MRYPDPSEKMRKSIYISKSTIKDLNKIRSHWLKTRGLDVSISALIDEMLKKMISDSGVTDEI